MQMRVNQLLVSIIACVIINHMLIKLITYYAAEHMQYKIKMKVLTLIFLNDVFCYIFQM